MKKTIYAIIFLSITFFVLQWNSTLCANRTIDYSVQNNSSEYINYKIYSYNKTIYINQLATNSYVMIFDSAGRNIYKQTANNSFISVSVYDKGMYIVRIQTGKDISTQRIFVR